MLRVFISHSTDTSDQVGCQYLRDLVDGLEGVERDGKRVFDVFLDRNALRGGDDWKQKIVNHLVHCHAAIIVISERALTSDFVKFEFSNLLARRMRERDPNTQLPLFPVIPLFPWLGGGGDRKVAQAKFMQGLGEGFWRAIGALELNFVAPVTVAEALPLLEATLAALPSQGDGALEPLAREIAKYLRSVSRSSLDDLGDELELTPPAEGWTAEDMAGRLLLVPPRDLYTILLKLNADLSRESKSALFELLAPSWVSPEAALALRPLLGKPPSRQCPVVNGILPDFTPEMYIRRALGRVRKFAGIFHTVREPTAVDGLAELRLLVSKLFVPGDPLTPGYSTRVKQQIIKLTQLDRPVVIAVHVSSLESLRMVATLSQEDDFKALVFFTLTGAGPLELDDPTLARLQPPLFADQENELRDLYAQIEAEAL